MCSLHVILLSTVTPRFFTLAVCLSLSLSPMLRPTVTLGIKHPSGTYDQIFLLSDSCWLFDVGRYLWREDGSVVYNCCWPSPMQSFSVRNPLGLVTIFYCLKFETSFFVASCDSQGYVGGIRPLLHTGFFSFLLSESKSKLCYYRRSVGQSVLE
jgi:hypothetical protein